jgi:hypothetical protein
MTTPVTTITGFLDFDQVYPPVAPAAGNARLFLLAYVPVMNAYIPGQSGGALAIFPSINLFNNAFSGGGEVGLSNHMNMETGLNMQITPTVGPGDEIDYWLTKLTTTQHNDSSGSNITENNIDFTSLPAGSNVIWTITDNPTNDRVQISGSVVNAGQASFAIQENNTPVASQPNLNFITGSGATLSVVNDPSNQSVDVTIGMNLGPYVQGGVSGPTGEVAIWSTPDYPNPPTPLFLYSIGMITFEQTINGNSYSNITYVETNQEGSETFGFYGSDTNPSSLSQPVASYAFHDVDLPGIATTALFLQTWDAGTGNVFPMLTLGTIPDFSINDPSMFFNGNSFQIKGLASAPPVSKSGYIGLYYNTTANHIEYSINGGAWTVLV